MFPLTAVNELIKLEGFHNIYYFEFGKFHYHAPEKHSFWEMVYVDKGTVLANTEGSVCTLKEGQAIFHSPGQIHSHVSNKEVANNLLVVSFSVSGELNEFFGGKVFTLDKTGRKLLSLFTNEARNALGTLSGDFHDSRPLDFSGEKRGASQLMGIYFTEFLLKLSERSNISGTSVAESVMTADTSNGIADKIIEYLILACYALIP